MSSNCIRALVLFSELSFILVFVVLKLQILARDRNALANYMQACMQFLLIDATVLKHASSSRLLCLNSITYFNRHGNLLTNVHWKKNILRAGYAASAWEHDCLGTKWWLQGLKVLEAG